MLLWRWQKHKKSSQNNFWTVFQRKHIYTPYNVILRLARNLLETRIIMKILTHPSSPSCPRKLWLIFMGIKQKKIKTANWVSKEDPKSFVAFFREYPIPSYWWFWEAWEWNGDVCVPLSTHFNALMTTRNWFYDPITELFVLYSHRGNRAKRARSTNIRRLRRASHWLTK